MLAGDASRWQRISDICEALNFRCRKPWDVPIERLWLVSARDDTFANRADLLKVPALWHRPDFGLLEHFAAGTLGQELVHEGLLEFGGEGDQPFLPLDRPLHSR